MWEENSGITAFLNHSELFKILVKFYLPKFVAAVAISKILDSLGVVLKTIDLFHPENKKQ